MDVLVLAPHPDDMEFGCGGTIKRLTEMGANISLLVFSTCDKSLPKDYTVTDLKQEQLAAAGLLGVAPDAITFYDFPVREFPTFRQPILEEMIAFKKKSGGIDLVFTPSTTDMHQDHATISQESIRAFKETCLLGYELPWNDLAASYNYYVRLSEKLLSVKEQAIEGFASQSARPYGARHIRSLAEVRGLQVKASYAEAFEVIRWIID